MASTFELLALTQANFLQNNTPQLIATTKLAAPAASIAITVPAGYSSLMGVWGARSSQASAVVNMVIRLNADTGNNYLWQEVQVENTTVTGANSSGVTSFIQIGIAPGASATANYYGAGDFTIPAPGGALFKTVIGKSFGIDSTSDSFVGTYGGQWLNTAVITSVTLIATAGNLVAGSQFSLYGLA